jgi:hypothetical protein
MALHWFEGMCAGVAYLHDHGIVHRDLKPANIFLDESRVKIGDYGLSKFISCSRRSGQTESVGTVHYMAPEIANGRYGREIDSYALGIILYEMLTGRVPFEGESVGEVLMKHLTAEPDLSNLEEPFQSVVRGAMAKDPERRIDSAAQMLAMVRGAAGDVSPEAFAAPPFVNRPDGATAQASPARAGSPAAPVAPASPGPALAIRAFFHREPEPVAEGFRRAWAAFVRDLKWNSWTPLPRFVLIFAVIMFMIGTGPVWFTGILAYIAYRFVRLFVQVVTDPPGGKHPQRQPVPPAYAATVASPTYAASASTPHEGSSPVESDGAEAQPVAAVAPAAERQRPKWRRRGQGTWRFAAYDELAAQPIRRRASTMLGSMLAAAAIAPVATFLVYLFTLGPFDLELFLWGALVATFASWAIMIPAQAAEGRVEDQAPMRFTMLLVGTVVGIVAYGLSQVMFLELPASHDISGFAPRDAFSGAMLQWRNTQLEAGYDFGRVNLPFAHFTAFFAFMFLVSRWWKQAEWTRPSRVSLWSVAWAGAVGFFVSLFWWFPQPICMILAVVISFTVQLASPWLSPRRRRTLAETAVA